jgi:hypothetical protein
LAFLQVELFEMRFSLRTRRVCSAELHDWVKKLQGHEKNILRDLRFLHILALVDVRLDWTLLGAVVQFWDPEHHVFRFNGIELSPTLEEFSALTGLSLHRPLAIISPRDGFSSDLSQWLGLKKSSKYAFREGQIKCTSNFILEHFYRQWCSPGDPRARFCMHALIARFCSEVLFSWDSSSFEFRLLEIVRILSEDSATLVPLILAETYAGLSACVSHSTRVLRGCPALLQVNCKY